MSTLTDAAELDAAIAENELEDTAAERLRELTQEGLALPDALEQVLAERDGAQPPPPLPAPAEQPPGEPTDKELRALDREQTRHVAKVHEIMGAHVAGFAECEKCGGLGLMPPGPQPRSHEYFIACPTCNGYGEVFTGSLRAGRESTDCPGCGGSGYLEKLDGNGVPLSQGGNSAAAPPSAPPPPELVPVDGQQPQTVTPPTYGRPAWMGDPSIGS